MTPAERFTRLEASAQARGATDVTRERRPMPKFMESRRAGGMRLPSQGRVVDFPASFSLASKPWQVVKIIDGAGIKVVERVVLSAHGTQADAEARAGEGRDALTDAEVGLGWNVIAERRGRR